MEKTDAKIKRLIFATGPWQIIMAISAMHQASIDSNSLYEDHLLLCLHNLSNETKQVMIQIAKVLWTWASMVRIDEDVLDLNIIEFTEISFWKYSIQIKNHIGIDKVNEIWLCLVAGRIEKLLMESYQNANIILYEDGLCLYSEKIDYSNYLDKGFRSTIRKLKHQSRNLILNKKNKYIYSSSGLLQQHTNRLSKAYLLLGDTIKPPKYLSKILIKNVNNVLIRNSIDKINHAIKFEVFSNSCQSSDSMMLVLSQCFAKWNRMSWDEEFNVYRGVFKRLVQRGITPLWKEHPRADKPFFPALLDDDWDIIPIELNVHFAWPIEVLVHQINIIGCISISSSSLFYLKKLFDIPTYTLANEVTLSKHDTEIAQLAIDRIPAFSSMFES